MASTDRSTLINKLYRAAKKKYSFVPPLSNRSVLEHSLYAACLENGTYEAADEAFAMLEKLYFDWNEVRVTTTEELAEKVKCLHRPMAGAMSVRKTLHGVFETFYSFELDYLRKENLRKTVKQFEEMKSVTPFVVSYTAQVALGGHSIPLDNATLLLMHVCGIISESEAAKGKVPGLERTIAKNKGIEFISIVHQLAADFYKSPFNKDLRAFILKIAPDAKDRFPKRGGKKIEAVVEPPKAKEEAPAKEEKPADKKGAKKAAGKAPVKKKAATKKSATAVKKTTKKAPAKKKAAAKKTTKKAPAKKKAAKKPAKSSKKASKKSPSKRLSKKKPR